MKPTALNDEAAAKAMEAAGQRVTRQKMEVFHHLQRFGMVHPTAEEVYFGVKKAIPSISLGTVYNCLESLVSCNLLNRFSMNGSHSNHYEMRTREHHHLACLHCSKIFDVHATIPIEHYLKSDSGFEVTGYQLQLSGYCPDCAKHARNDRESKPAKG